MITETQTDGQLEDGLDGHAVAGRWTASRQAADRLLDR
jgi:hypothetical protein